MKRFIALILMVIVIASLVGCANVEDSQDDTWDDLGFTVLDHVGHTTSFDYYIVYDNETNVIYYLSPTSTGIALSPRYDANGEIMIYKGG